MVWIVILAALLAGGIAGGRISRFSELKLRIPLIFVIAFALQMVVEVGIERNITFISEYPAELYFASYIILIIGLVINITERRTVLLFLGSVMNFLCMATNSFKMPVSVDSLKTIGLTSTAEILKAGNMALYTPMTKETSLSFLGKIIVVPEPFWRPELMSLGDFILYLGIFAFIYGVMTDENIDRMMF